MDQRASRQQIMDPLADKATELVLWSLQEDMGSEFWPILLRQRVADEMVKLDRQFGSSLSDRYAPAIIGEPASWSNPDSVIGFVGIDDGDWQALHPDWVEPFEEDDMPEPPLLSWPPRTLAKNVSFIRRDRGSARG